MGARRLPVAAGPPFEGSTGLRAMTSGSVRRTDLRLSARTLRDAVHEQLLEDIIQGRFSPGQRLNETELSAAYGVSRGPIREAIRTLEGQGLLKVIPNRGAVVTRLSRADVEEIYAIRIELEGLAARTGVDQMSGDVVLAMERQLRFMDAALDEPGRWQTHTNEFHLILYRAARLPRLYGLISDLMNATAPYARLFLDMAGRADLVHPDHVALLEAIKERDVERVERITEEHLARSAKAIVNLIAEE